MTVLLKISAAEFIFAGGAVTDKDTHLRLNAGQDLGVLAVPGTITPHGPWSGLGSSHHLYLDYGVNGLGWARIYTTHVDLAGYQVGV
jgi:hypothetical protein